MSPALNLLDDGERSLKLEPRTMDVLVYLAARPGEVVAVEALLGAVWQGVVVSDSSVYHAIKQLRQALARPGDDSPYIETIPKRGYRLVAPVASIGPEEAAEQPSVPPVPPGTPTAARRSNRTAPGRLLAATAIALVAAVALLGWLRSADAPVQRGLEQPLRFSIPVEGFSGVAVSRDGRYLAYGAGPTMETAMLHVRPLDSIEARPIAGTEGIYMPFWSPDGTQLGFLAFTEHRVRRVAVSGGPPQDLASTPIGTSGSWNRNGVVLFDSSTGIARVPAGGGEAVKVTALDEERGEVAHVQPSFLPNGRHFLFATAFSNPGVFVGSLDSPERVQVLPYSATAMYTGGYLLFNRGAALFAQPFDAETLTLRDAPVQLADGLITDAAGVFASFSVSDNGVLAYATGESLLAPAPTPSPTQLAWYDRNGRRLESVGEPGLYRGIELSPDGKRVVVHRHEAPDGGNLWLRDLDRGTFSRITFGGSHDLWPVWSPDGTAVLFSGAGLDIHRTRADGIGGEQLVVDSLRAPAATDWRGDSVLVTHVPAQGGDIAVLELGAASPTPTPLIATAFSEGWAVFAPDGGKLAYMSNESGRFEIYVSSYPALDDKLQVSTNGGTTPRWSRDGTELFYLADDGTLMSVPVGTDGSLLAPRPLFTANFASGDHWGSLGELRHRVYDVSPDGLRFLVNERVAGDAPPSASATRASIVVVVNWAAALEPRALSAATSDR